MKRYRPNPLCWAVFLGCLAPGGDPAARGEISYDGTLRGKNLADDSLTQNGELKLNNNVWTIRVDKDGVASKGGRNVFFSFGKFKVDSGETADFNCAGDRCGGVKNLISRVGILNQEKAEIYGRVTESGPAGFKPNFWMISPNGVVLGESGMIDVPGALHVGTSSAIEFPDRRFGKGFGTKVVDGKRQADPEGVTGNSTLDADPRSFGFLDGDDAGIELGKRPDGPPVPLPGSDPAVARLQADGGVTLASAGQVTVHGAVEVAGAGGNGASHLKVTGGTIKPSVQILAGGRIVSRGNFDTEGDVDVAGGLEVAQANVAGTMTVSVSGQVRTTAAASQNPQALAPVSVGGALDVAGGSVDTDGVMARGVVRVNLDGKMSIGRRLTSDGEIHVGYDGTSGLVEGKDGRNLEVTGKAVNVHLAGSAIRKSGAGYLAVTALGKDADASSKRALDASGGGMIEASNDGNLTVESKAGSVTLTGPDSTIRKTTDGNYTVKAGQTLTVRGGWNHGLAGNVDLKGGAVVVEGGALIKSGKGDLAVTATDPDGKHVDDAGNKLERALTLREVNGVAGRIEAANVEKGALTVQSEGAIDLQNVPQGFFLPPAHNIAKTTDGNVTITAGRKLTVAGDWNYDKAGDVKLQGETVAVAAKTRLEHSGSGDLSMEGSSAVTVDGLVSYSGNKDLRVKGGNVTVNQGGTLTRSGSGALELSGDSISVNGTVSHDGDGLLSIKDGGVTIGADGVVSKTKTGGLTIDTLQDITVGGHLSHAGGGLLSIQRGKLDVTAGGHVAKSGRGNLEVDTEREVAVGGDMAHDGDGELSIKNGTVTIRSAGTVTKTGTGGLTIDTQKDITVGGSLVHAGGGLLSIQRGKLDVTAGGQVAKSGRGNLEVDTEREVAVGGDMAHDGDGELSIKNGTVTIRSAGTVTKTGTGGLTIDTQKDITVGGSLVHAGEGLLSIQRGKLDVTAGGQVAKSGHGNLEVETEREVAVDGDLAMRGGSVAVTAGTDATVDQSGRITHSGSGELEIKAPSITVDGAVNHSGSGELAISNGAVTVGASGRVAKSGKGGLTLDTPGEIKVAGLVNHDGDGLLKVANGKVVIEGTGQVLKSGTGDLAVDTAQDISVSGSGRIVGNNGGSLNVTGNNISLTGGRIEKTAGGDATVTAVNDLTLANSAGIHDGSRFDADPAVPTAFGTALVNNFTVTAGHLVQLDGGSRVVGNHDGVMTVTAGTDAIQVGRTGSSGLIATIAQPGGRGGLTVSAPRVEVTGQGSAILLGAAAENPAEIAVHGHGANPHGLPAPIAGDLLVEATGDDPASGSALRVTDRGRIVGNAKAGQGGDFGGDVVVRAVQGSRGDGKKHRSTVAVDGGGLIQKLGPNGDLKVTGGDVDIVNGGKVVMGNLSTSGRGDGPNFQRTQVDPAALDRSTGKLTITALNRNSLTIGSAGDSGRTSFVLSTSAGGIDLASARRINLGRSYIVENSGTADGGNILFRSAANGQPITVTANGLARVTNIGAGVAGNSILFERGPSTLTFDAGRTVFQTLTGPGDGGTNFNPLRYGWTVQDYQAAELAVTQTPLPDTSLPEYLSSVGFAATSQSKLGDFPTGILRSLDRVTIGRWQTPIDLDSIVANPCGRAGSSLVMQGLAGYAADPSATIPSPAAEPAALGAVATDSDGLRLAANDVPAGVECD